MWLSVIGDNEEAILWYKKAAEQGNLDAMSALGGGYYFGNGTEVNKDLAFKWINKSANQGHIDSMMILGMLYEEKGDQEKGKRSL